MSPEALIFPISHFLKDLSHSAMLSFWGVATHSQEARIQNQPECPAADGCDQCNDTGEKEEKAGPANLPACRVNPGNCQSHFCHHCNHCHYHCHGDGDGQQEQEHLETIRVNFFGLNPLPGN